MPHRYGLLAPLALAACSPAADPVAQNDGANTAAPATAPANGAADVEPAQASIRDAWIRLPAITGRPAAAYFTIVGGAVDDAVVAVESPAFARAELHETVDENGVARMQASERVPFTAGARLDLAPGGRHVMLFDPKGDLKPGGTAELTIAFAGSPNVTVQAELRAPSGEAMAHGGDHGSGHGGDH